MFAADHFDDVDLVLALDSGHVRELLALAPDDGARDKVHLLRSFDPAAATLEVPDPYYGALRGFSDVLAMIESAAEGVVEHVRRELAK